MKTTIQFTLVAIVCLTGISVQADEPTNDESRLQGVWTFSRGETNGRAMSEVFRTKGINDLTIKISGNSMTMSGSSIPDHKYTFTLKPKESPKVIDFVTVETHGKAPQGTKLKGIYAIEDGQLKLCLASDSTVKRPKTFEAPEGSRLSMLILTRTDGGQHAEP